jgi:hypothetical protein
MNRALRIYGDAVQQRQMAVQRAYDGDVSRIRPWDGSTPTGPYYLWDFFPPAFNCPIRERLGRISEGGKVVCGIESLAAKEKRCVVFSFGVRGDITFEEDLIRRTNCTVFAFNPSVPSLPNGQTESRGCPSETGGVIYFRKEGLGSSNRIQETGWTIHDIPTLMKKLSVTHIDLLKIDIEGGEWEVFSRSSNREWLKDVDQLLIELHLKQLKSNEAGVDSGVREVFDFFDTMENHMLLPFSWEVNHNPSGYFTYKPSCIEYSFIRPSAIASDFAPIRQDMPGEIDTKKQNFATALKNRNKEQSDKHEAGRRDAITVLTRVQSDLSKYDQLINRTESLLLRPWTTKYFDFVIFHEPKMPPSHEEYIRKKLKRALESMKSSTSALIFEDVSDLIGDGIGAMRGKHLSTCPPTFKSQAFTDGYKGMIYFWYGGFMKTEAAKRYKSFFRIDDDIRIVDELDQFTPQIESRIAAASFFPGSDSDAVTVGMNELFFDIASTLGLGWDPEKIKNPYTNVLWIDLEWARSPTIQYVIQKVHESGCILSNRWGDLPLWGATAALAGVNIEVLPLRYYHGSHHVIASPSGFIYTEDQDSKLRNQALKIVVFVGCILLLFCISRRRQPLPVKQR